MCGRGRRMQTETSAPMTKAKNTATTPNTGPSNQPMPSASFASPRPIQRPLEKSQSAKRGAAAIGPAKISHQSNSPASGVKNCEANASPANAYTHPSGMMVCRRSYTVMQMRSAAIMQKIILWAISRCGAAPIAAKRIAVAASTSGYWSEMPLPPPRQRPRSASQETTGTMSCQSNWRPQDMQADLPERARAPRLNITTLRKLPTMRPNMPKIKAVTIRQSIAVVVYDYLRSTTTSGIQNAPLGAFCISSRRILTASRSTQLLHYRENLRPCHHLRHNYSRHR